MAYFRVMVARTSLLGIALLLLGGCGGGGSGTICSQACDKMHACGLDKIHITSVNAYEPCTYAQQCDKTTDCISACFMSASCGDLQQVVLGGKFHSCLVVCNPYFRVPDAGP